MFPSNEKPPLLLPGSRDGPRHTIDIEDEEEEVRFISV